MSLKKTLSNACEGKSFSQGGLNVPEFKNELINLIPHKATEIRKMTRSQLQAICQKELLKRKPKLIKPKVKAERKKIPKLRKAPKVKAPIVEAVPDIDMVEKLPPDMIKEILFKMDYQTIINMCQVSKRIRTICQLPDVQTYIEENIKQTIPDNVPIYSQILYDRLKNYTPDIREKLKDNFEAYFEGIKSKEDFLKGQSLKKALKGTKEDFAYMITHEEIVSVSEYSENKEKEYVKAEKTEKEWVKEGILYREIYQAEEDILEIMKKVVAELVQYSK